MLRENYFEGRLKDIGSDPKRAAFAAREVATIEIMQTLVGRRLICSSGVVADIGCGDRFLQPEFEKRDMTYAGFDIDDGNLEHDPLPAQDGTFDLMVSYSLIEHLRDPSNMLSEARRCLKPGGHLLIETPNWRYCQHDFFNDYTHVKPYTPGSLRALLTHNGFNVVADFPNLRCQPLSAYKGKRRYARANLRPFPGTVSRLVPPFLKGRARGIFMIAELSQQAGGNAE